ncbi:MAG TPA: hypothetical protein HPP51_03115 [Planctomycetes bacterium]|nr:hypothetical protein [Planctomycetota bacterium]
MINELLDFMVELDSDEWKFVEDLVSRERSTDLGTQQTKKLRRIHNKVFAD